MIKIGLSYYGNKINNYIDWIKSYSFEAEIFKLHHELNNLSELKNCTSLLLPGGGDIDPEIYGADNTQHLSKNIDRNRDLFEIDLIKYAVELQIPILGICRGLQIVNVCFEGTLKQHIMDHRSSNQNEDLTHWINVEYNSLLYSITNSIMGKVNSSHHQCIDKIGENLRPISYSNDGVVEALEFKDSSNMPPTLLVQWHPERMEDRNENPFSYNLLKWFMNTQKKF
ncbi:MAG: gamma-glutamyl-gamma-aminobutyrate hydrolase family protein [Ignavibacteria bacterium]|nr:gamma-glutamyl-gamma-aminobutyrate hydrolase family protein [Ignavibacteria bacterium]